MKRLARVVMTKVMMVMTKEHNIPPHVHQTPATTGTPRPSQDAPECRPVECARPTLHPAQTLPGCSASLTPSPVKLGLYS